MTLQSLTDKMDSKTRRDAILEMAWGYISAQCIFAAARLGIADLLQDGPKHCDDLAEATNTHSDSLYHVLRVLTDLGYFVETQPKHFHLAPAGVCLQADRPGSLRNYLMFLGDVEYRCWENLVQSLQSGQSIFQHTYSVEVFDYFKQNPPAGELFDRGMTELSAGNNALVAQAYDFSEIAWLVDVGGGQGGLLAAILQRYPTLKGTLLDLTHAVEKAQPLLSKAGVIDRCELIAGDFFTPLPAGADAYLLKNVLHNWNDERATEILRNCYQAMKSNSRLLVIERIAQADSPLKVRLLALRMNLTLPSGRVRTQDELAELFAVANFKLTKIYPTETDLSLIEAIATEK